MRLWIILAAVFLVLWLVSLVRIGTAVRYGQGGLGIQLKVGALRFQLWPLKKKDKPPKKRKKKKGPLPEKPQETKADLGGSLALVRKFLPLAAEAAGRFKRKLRMDNLELTLVWGASDAAAAAFGFGMANGAIGMLWPLIEHNFDVRKRQIRTGVNYQATAPTVALGAELSLTIGQGLAISVILAYKVLLLLRSHKKESLLKEAV